MKTVLKDIGDLIVKSAKKAGRDDILTFGAAIAFYTIFSIAPLLVLVVSIGSFFLSEEAVLMELSSLAGDFLEDDVIQNISSTISDRTTGGAGILTSAIAVFTILFGATTVVMQLKTALNRIWNVREVEMSSFKSFALNRLISFGMILILSFLLVSSLIAEALLGLVGRFFTGWIPLVEIDYYLLFTQFGTAAFAIIAFTLIFKILPDVHARWKDVFIGGIVTTVLFLAGKYLIGFYFSAADVTTTYRAAGSLVVFIIWVYYNVIIVLVGAVITQVYTEKFGGNILPYKFVTLEGFPAIRKKSDKIENH